MILGAQDFSFDLLCSLWGASTGEFPTSPGPGACANAPSSKLDARKPLQVPSTYG